MSYKAEVQQEFLGKINGVQFYDKSMYYSVMFTLDVLDDYEIAFDSRVIKALYRDIERVWMKTDMAIGEIEHDIYDSISANNRLPEDYGYQFAEVNELLSELSKGVDNE